MDNETKKNNSDKTIPILEDRYLPGMTNSLPGINTPEISLPAFNPPVPNRAWTAMKSGMDIEELSEEEKRDLYLGSDGLI